jgi:two-component system phosphate regulon response regulator OmpR
MIDNARIIVVDDDPDVCETMAEYLGMRGFEVVTAHSGDTLRELIAGQAVDLVLLDLNLPGDDGLTLARFLREQTDVGIIMVTAASETVDRVVGLEMGADDYVGKPVDLRELLARVKSVLRRTMASRITANRAAPAASGNRRVRMGQFSLDLDARQLIAEDGGTVPLTSMEFDLLEAFATHPNRVLTRDQLLDMAHKRDWEPFDRSIDIRIARIRRKIEADPAKPSIIKTIRGAGYMFVNDTAT